MRLRTAGVGLALALSASPILAQGQPAATLGRLRPVEDPVATTARGQFPDVRTVTPPPAVRPLFRTQVAPATPAPVPGAIPSADPLGQPRPIPGPMVTEYRDQNGQPVPMGQPIPLGGPVPLASTPVYAVPPPLTSAPYCPPGTPIPVTPSAPGFATPALEDPYVGGTAGTSALFPRAGRMRSALVGEPGSGRFTVGAEYLLWYVRAQATPTLFTTSSPQFNGILGQGDTRPLFGNQVLGKTHQDGGRFTASYLFPNQNWGVDGSIFVLGNNSGSYFLNSASDALIARPFTNLNSGQPFSQLTAFPGLSSGSARIDYDTNLWGAEVNAKRALACTPCSRLDLLVGFKNLNLNESLVITENFARVPGSPTSIGVPNALAGTVEDRFRTENHFYGVNLGLHGEFRRGRWYVDGKASVALGQIYQSAIIEGSQTILTTTGVTRANGGLLALPGANIGSYTQSRFGVLPEAGLTVGVYLTPHLRVGVGYNFMYLNSVVRPAAQIDTGLDVTRIPNFPLNPAPTPLPGGTRPSAFPLRDTDFFVQGLNFQLQWTW